LLAGIQFAAGSHAAGYVCAVQKRHATGGLCVFLTLLWFIETECQRKIEGGPKKGLANLWSGKKIRKKAHAGRGPETKWEMSGNMCALPEET
jgi:hypothetical protein